MQEYLVNFVLSKSLYNVSLPKDFSHKQFVLSIVGHILHFRSGEYLVQFPFLNQEIHLQCCARVWWNILSYMYIGISQALPFTMWCPFLGS